MNDELSKSLVVDGSKDFSISSIKVHLLQNISKYEKKLTDSPSAVKYDHITSKQSKPPTPDKDTIRLHESINNTPVKKLIAKQETFIVIHKLNR